MVRAMSRIESGGYIRGRQEAQQEERREIVYLLLTNKFGPLPETTVAQIDLLDLSQLRELLNDLLSFATLADLDRWLTDHGT